MLFNLDCTCAGSTCSISACNIVIERSVQYFQLSLCQCAPAMLKQELSFRFATSHRVELHPTCMLRCMPGPKGSAHWHVCRRPCRHPSPRAAGVPRCSRLHCATVDTGRCTSRGLTSSSRARPQSPLAAQACTHAQAGQMTGMKLSFE